MYVTIPLANPTVPCVFAPAVTDVTLSNWLDSFAGPALSFAVKSLDEKLSGVSSWAVLLSSEALGESLTSVTPMLTVDVFE